MSKSIEPDQPVHVLVAFDPPVASFTGYLTVERADLETIGAEPQFTAAPVASYQVQYDGLAMETMSLEVKAPTLAGFYRVALRDEPTAPPSGADELIVQQP